MNVVAVSLFVEEAGIATSHPSAVPLDGPWDSRTASAAQVRKCRHIWQPSHSEQGRQRTASVGCLC
jgi:hypothetical protein